MQSRIDILNELGEISPFLANVGYQDVYRVPPAYFDTLADQVMNRIKSGQTSFETKDGTGQSSLLTGGIPQKNPFNTPEGYFEGFAEKMMARIKASEAGSVSEELEALSPLLSRIDKKMPFITPVGYFNELADNMMGGAKAIEFVNEELENLSPLMNSLKDKNVYETPAGYFDSFAGTVLNNIKQPLHHTKVISINKKRNWLKYAVAAVFIGVVATGSILFFYKPISSNSTNPINLSKVSDQEMMNYLEDQATPPIATDESNSIASVDIDETDAKDLLSDIPDDELQQYVDEHVNSKDLIIN